LRAAADKIIMSDTRVICPECHIEIGQIVEINGLAYLRAGGLLIKSMSAICIQCGSVVYWSVSDKAIEDMLKKSDQVIININQ